ncbi:MAG: polysaccharide deacetylase [Firmicutes bacterium]|nr:polysaccharide deacetylase [Bacillota bacterium]
MNRCRKIGLAVGLAGLLFLACFWRTPLGVPILAYHMVGSEEDRYSVSAEEFDRQMDYFAKKGYTAVSLQELADGFAGKIVLPPKPVVITFDDGYNDNYLIALPIMEKHGMKGTVFVVAGQVGQGQYLSWDQIRALQERGTEIGSHTMSHVALSDSDKAGQYREVAESKQLLERELGLPVAFLAYPYGKFTAETVSALQAAGYRGACAGTPGLNAPGSDLYRLHRVNVPKPRFGLWELRVRLLRAEIYYMFETIKNRL